MKKIIVAVCAVLTLIAIGSVALAICIPHYKSYTEYKDGLLQTGLNYIRYVENPEEDFDFSLDDADKYDVYYAELVVRNKLNFPIYSLMWNDFKKDDCELRFIPGDDKNVIDSQKTNLYDFFYIFKKGTSQKRVMDFIENCEYSCSYTYRNQEYTEKVDVFGLDSCEKELTSRMVNDF